MSSPTLFSQIIAHSKEYGFVFPSSEIYDGLSAVYDFGPYGVQLKKNIKDLWWREMTQLNPNIVGLDSAIFMHPTTWKASGHLDHFSDPLIDNKESKKRYRVDHLVEAHASILKEKGATTQALNLLKKTDTLLAENDFKGLENLLRAENICCPVSGTNNWSPIRQFNLMFATQLGSIAEESAEIYLRPETAQGIFVNFLNVQKSARMKVPFGIAQIGKAFRNEIVARQFIFRMREFEQMEMQFFIPPDTQKEWFTYWEEKRLQWYLQLGISETKLKKHPHTQLAHYADAAIDITYQFPFGHKEVEGIHSRTDFDLKNHTQYSTKKLFYFDPQLNKNYIPYVIETSVGVERLFLMVLCESYTKEKLQQGDTTEERTLLKIPKAIAPNKVAILPLVKKDGLPTIAHEIYAQLAHHYPVQYDEKDSIGKRYRRQDAIGTPYCLTIDYETQSESTITLRDRDTMQQTRIPVANIEKYIQEKMK